MLVEDFTITIQNTIINNHESRNYVIVLISIINIIKLIIILE